MRGTRINKYLAECGVASRRASEQLVRDGRLRINSSIVTELSTQVYEDDKVEVDGKVIQREVEKVYIALNKPRGCVTTCNDEKGRKTVLDVIGDVNGLRIFPVGRLDYDTEGLLILTNDGEFARAVTHPSSQIQKKYVASVDADVTDLHVKELRTLADKVSLKKPRIVEIAIHEGKNRQVRKMCEAVGLNVVRLKRVAIGRLKLDNLDLKSGEWKYVEKGLLFNELCMIL